MDTVLHRVLAESAETLPLEDVLAGVLLPSRSLDVARRTTRDLLSAGGGLERLARMGPRELESELRGVTGLPRLTGLRLASALELGRRAARVELPTGQVVRGLADLEPHLRSMLDGRLKEQFIVVLLDARNRPLRTERVSEGCLTWSVVHPREVFAPAVRESAGAVIVAHNHPSGDPTPSAQDVEVTGRLARAGELLGIPLLDHIVVGRRRCISMRAQGLLGSAVSTE
ncbi:MAG: JAB domain-containing protein [Planctomycetota bacterium]